MKRFFSEFLAVLGVHLQEAVLRPGALLVALAGAAGTTFIFVSVLAIANGVSATTNQLATAAVALITARDAPLETSSSLSEEAVNAIHDAQQSLRGPIGGKLLSPEHVSAMDTVSAGGESGSQVLGRGLTASGLKLRPGFRIIEGRLFTPGRWEVVVGSRLAREVAGLEVGQTITGSVRDWTIVGVFETDSSAGASEVWMDLDTVRMETGARSDINVVRIGTASASEVASLREFIEGDTRHRLRVISVHEYQQRQSAALIERIQWVASGLALILGVGAVVASMNTMYSAITARQRSLATMRAVGFDAAPMAVAVFVEATLLALTGGVLGGLAALTVTDGYGLSLLNPETNAPLALNAAVSPCILVQGILAAATLGVVAAVFPTIKVARMPILMGLRGA